MARVTVEDCVLKVPNRFELVLLAAQRAKNLSTGAQMTVDQDRDKNPVVALREIAEETIDLDNLKNALVTGMQKNIKEDVPVDEDESIKKADAELAALKDEFAHLNNPETEAKEAGLFTEEE